MLRWLAFIFIGIPACCVWILAMKTALVALGIAEWAAPTMGDRLLAAMLKGFNKRSGNATS